MWTELVFLALGGVVGWATSYYFYQKANRERPEWWTLEGLEKLITDDPSRIEWNPKQLVRIFNERMRYPANDLGGFSGPDWRFCPQCGGEALEGSSFSNNDDTYHELRCKDCGYKEGT